MAWKWYEITTYKVELGGNTPQYYASVQLFCSGFRGLIKFAKSGPLPNAIAPIDNTGQRFFGHLDFQQMPLFIDVLRNEKPVSFGWSEEDPNQFQLMTGEEPIGEGDGLITLPL